MPNTHITKNYFAHGGDELVIGGKLTFLTGAEVEGGEGLLDGGGSSASFVPAAYQADSTASTVAALKEDFNALLAALRTAGLMAAEAAETPAEQSGGGE